MIRDFLFGLKLKKYGYRTRSYMFMGFFFFVLGIICLFGKNTMPMIGVLYIPLGMSYFFSQGTATLEYSNLVAASPKRRSIAIHFQDVGSMIWGVLPYIPLVAFLKWKYPKTEEVIGFENFSYVVVLLVEVLFLLQISFACHSRLFILSMIVAVSPILNLNLVPIMIAVFINRFGETAIILLGFLVVIMGALIGAVIRRRIYHYSLSKWGLGAAMAKNL